MTGSALITPTGISAIGAIGQVTIWGKITPTPGTTWARIAA
jgi:hypothetical protein